MSGGQARMAGRREAPWREQTPREGRMLEPNPARHEGQDLEVRILPPLSLELRVEIWAPTESRSVSGDTDVQQ